MRRCGRFCATGNQSLDKRCLATSEQIVVVLLT
jgi:hypothetical protein